MEPLQATTEAFMKRFSVSLVLETQVMLCAGRLPYFVICCGGGKGEAAMIEMRRLMSRLGLEVSGVKVWPILLHDS
jgi:hypothetical protein